MHAHPRLVALSYQALCHGVFLRPDVLANPVYYKNDLPSPPVPVKRPLLGLAVDILLRVTSPKPVRWVYQPPNTGRLNFNNPTLLPLPLAPHGLVTTTTYQTLELPLPSVHVETNLPHGFDRLVIRRAKRLRILSGRLVGASLVVKEPPGTHDGARALVPVRISHDTESLVDATSRKLHRHNSPFSSFIQPLVILLSERREGRVAA
mmetsp:Transcript_23339/g.48569  ORF Transcript_23339/g.48569 Transcript_23339/m.48569 type:complete len:206 (+) Transcript_23339:466-1083(+)